MTWVAIKYKEPRAAFSEDILPTKVALHACKIAAVIQTHVPTHMYSAVGGRLIQILLETFCKYPQFPLLQVW